MMLCKVFERLGCYSRQRSNIVDTFGYFREHFKAILERSRSNVVHRVVFMTMLLLREVVFIQRYVSLSGQVEQCCLADATVQVRVQLDFGHRQE